MDGHQIVTLRFPLDATSVIKRVESDDMAIVAGVLR